MTARLRKREVQSIKALIDGWTGRVTWPQIVERAERILGRETTRQTLASHMEIRLAYLDKKAILKDAPEPASVHTLKSAADRIKRLTDDVSRLTQENQRLLNQFVVWQYNASLANLSMEDLNRPMVAIHRKGEK